MAVVLEALNRVADLVEADHRRTNQGKVRSGLPT